MARPKGQFAKLVKPKPTVKATDKRWLVRRPHPEKIGRIKTESFREERKAIKRRDDLNAIHETERGLLASEHWTVATVLDFWVERKASKLIGASKEVPRAEYISKVIGSVAIVDLTEDHYEHLYKHIKQDETRRVKSERGFDAYFVTLRTALNYARKKRHIRSYPAFDDYIVGDFDGRDRVATDDEMDALLKACYVVKGGRDRKHLAPIIEWLHETACRSGELKTISVKDIDLDKGIVKIRQSKRKAGSNPKPRNCGISPRLYEVIHEMNLMEYSQDTLVIAEPLGFDKAFDFKKAFSTACRLAEPPIEDLHIHDLRTTGITNMLERGIPVPLVASMVGHEPESIMTLKIYTKFRERYIAQEMQKMAA